MEYESLWANRTLLFHRRGGAVGWLAFPAMLLFEALGPVVEIFGLFALFVGAAAGIISWSVCLTFLVLAVGLGLMLSAFALLLEELSFHIYPRLSHLLQLSGAMLFENFGYRQLTLWWRIIGMAEWLAQRPSQWGEMQRNPSWQVARPAPGLPKPTLPRVPAPDHSVDPAPGSERDAAAKVEKP